MVSVPTIKPITEMKIAKTVIFMQEQEEEDEADELELIAEGKKHNKTPADKSPT